MHSYNEFESQKKEIDLSKRQIKEKYESLIRQKEQEIQNMKEFEDKYFITKDDNRKLVEDIHAKTLELELLKNKQVSQEQEVVDKLRNRMEQLRNEKEQLQQSLRNTQIETNTLEKDIRLIDQEEGNQNIQQQQLQQAIEKIQNLEESLLRTQQMKEKELYETKNQIRSEKLIQIENQIEQLEKEIYQIKDKNSCLNCPNIDQDIYQLTLRAISLEKKRKIYSNPIIYPYVSHINCYCCHNYSQPIYCQKSILYQQPRVSIIEREPRVSCVIEREPRTSRVSVVRESFRRYQDKYSTSKSYEKGRRIKEIRTSSPILNYKKRYDQQGIDQGPVIEGYETKIEEFDSPIEQKNIIDQKVDNYLHLSRYSYQSQNHISKHDNLQYSRENQENSQQNIYIQNNQNQGINQNNQTDPIYSFGKMKKATLVKNNQ